MKILYFGTYDQEYPRNRVLISGLRQNGVNVLEINNRSVSLFKYLKLVLAYLKNKKRYDAMIVGFPGQESMFLASFLNFRFNSRRTKPIIFDAFTSHYGGYILDRKKYSPDSFRAKWYRWIDKKSVELSDIALLDTNTHIGFFVNELGLPRDKFERIFVGTDSGIFSPKNITKNTDRFLVHFHGHYIPLQGVEYIIRAAKLLEENNIEFNLIGKGQTHKKDRELAKKLKIENINFIDKASYGELANYINMSDVALGIFGNTPKTNLVIPNKVFEAIACSKPVITSETDAARELFTDRKNILFCRNADPEDLADKILKIKDDSFLRNEIAAAGYKIFQERCTEKILGEELIKIIKKL